MERDIAHSTWWYVYWRVYWCIDACICVLLRPLFWQSVPPPRHSLHSGRTVNRTCTDPWTVRRPCTGPWTVSRPWYRTVDRSQAVDRTVDRSQAVYRSQAVDRTLDRSQTVDRTVDRSQAVDWTVDRPVDRSQTVYRSQAVVPDRGPFTGRRPDRGPFAGRGPFTDRGPDRGPLTQRPQRMARGVVHIGRHTRWVETAPSVQLMCSSFTYYNFTNNYTGFLHMKTSTRNTTINQAVLVRGWNERASIRKQ